MAAEEPSRLVLGLAELLYVNGQTTDETLFAARRLDRALGTRSTLAPRWGVPGAPTGVHMARVQAAMTTVERVEAGELSVAAALARVEAIGRMPPAPTWLFTLAAGAGAVALAVIFGVQHVAAAALVFVSAAAGALLRRGVARYASNVFIQPFCAALLAGVIGALAVRYNLSSSLRLVAVCPCMILVPGPHILNGCLDVIRGRIDLGAARLAYAVFVVLAISMGLLLGLGLFGVALPVDPAGRAVPLWADVLAAGVAVCAYSVYFSAPPRILPWAVAVGMLAHALRWTAISVAGFGVATGAFVACVLVGLVLTPVARRWQMPFAAVAFASVVSLIPGVFLFRTASGLVQVSGGSDTSLTLLAATIGDAAIAGTIVLAMAAGLVIPKLVIDRVEAKWLPQRRHAADAYGIR